MNTEMNGPASSAGRSYAAPYDGAEEVRPAGLGATIGTLIALIVGLLALMVAYMPVLMSIFAMIALPVGFLWKSKRQRRAEYA